MRNLIFAILLISINVSATTYYVRTDGNNANAGTADNAGGAWRDAWYAAMVATGGDTVYVRQGTYGFVTNTVSGSSGSPITFVGDRDGSGNWLTIIDPSTLISSPWVTAPEAGPGIWKQTGMPFATREMTIGGKHVGYVSTNGNMATFIQFAYKTNWQTGFEVMSQPSGVQVTNNANFLYGSFWDGVEALFCSTGSVTYLRLRDGSDPSSLTIRVAPNNELKTEMDLRRPAWDFNGQSFITVSNFLIRGAYGGIKWSTGSHNNNATSNYLDNGWVNIYDIGGSYSNNIINNTFVYNWYGGPSGSWETSSQTQYRNKANQYLVSKFLMGSSSSAQRHIYLLGMGSNIVVTRNSMVGGSADAMGIVGTTVVGGIDISTNSISDTCSVGLYISKNNVATLIHDNKFSNCNVNMRPEEDASGMSAMSMYVYRNTFWQPDNIGDQFFFFVNGSTPLGIYPTNWIYHNSFSGSQGHIFVDSKTASVGGMTNTFILNNVFSDGVYVTGSAAWLLTTKIGVWDYNLSTPPNISNPAFFGAHNIKQGANVWPSSQGMDFTLPPDSPAIEAALDTSGSFTLSSVTYPALPDTATKLGAQWDMGALEKSPIWYVDIATPINGNGLSWATAWKDLTNIVWASINPGDTILVSQGNYAALNPTKGGAVGTNIIITPSQSPGRNAGVTNAGFFTAFGNITLDGGKDPSFSTLISNTVVVPQITNNIGWHVITTNTPNTDGAGTCINISGNATNGIVLRWLELTQLSDHKEDYGVRYNYSSPYMQDGNEIGYCWIHHVGQDGVKNFGSTGVHMDQTLIHHCLIEKTGDDGCELNSGYSVVNCIIRDARDQILRGHPDGISGQTFSYSRFVNNIIWGFKRSECFYLNTFAQSNISIWSYGNLVYWGDTNTLETAKAVGSYGMEDLYWAPQFGHTPGTSDTNIYWQDIRIFNNTFAAFPPYSVSPFNFFNRYRNGSDPNPLKWCTVWIIGGKMFNNVMYNGSGGAFGAANNIACDPSRLTIGWNNGFSTNTSGKSWQTEDGTWATGEAMDAANPGWYGDSSAQPTFVFPYPPQWDYRIAPTDSALTGKGTNLSAYVASMPGLDTDLYGVPRGTIWDVGASQHTGVDTNWIVWLRMTNDFSASGGKLVDSTGTGHDFYRIGLTNNPFPTNFPTSTSATNWLGGRTNQVAKFRESFIQNPDPRAAFEFGTWGALTNVDAFTNATQLSVTVWVATDTDRNNYSATVLDAGHAGLGCWSLGRYFSFPPTNNFMLTVSTNYAGGGNWDRDLSMVWPNNQQVYGGQWHFYAFTFNNGVCSIYFDGTNCGGTTLIGVTALSLWPCANNEDTTQPCLRWIALGCRTHNGNPAIWNWNNTTDYPNNGWFSGGIDDVRIFTEALTPAQILDIYNQSNSGGGGGGGTSSSLARVVNLRVGKTFIGP